MKTPRRVGGIVGSLALTVGLFLSGPGARARQDGAGGPQDPPKVRADDPQAAAPAESIAAIDAEFGRELARLQRHRLLRLARLAESQPREQADRTYEALFRLAIAGGLYAEAEPIAERVLKSGTASTPVTFLAEAINVVAEADRGAYEDSIRSLIAAVREADRAKAEPGAAPRPRLPVGTRLSLIEAYFQRLVQGDQFDAARKALRLIRDHAADAAVKDYVAARLRRLDLVGQPAPPIAGDDVDGRPVRLADYRGDVVLVEFWASWCPPCVEEVARLQRTYSAHRDRGFRVIGVNLDSLQDGGRSPEAVLPAVHRFLLDHNVPWPTILNKPGEGDIAKAYGVSELPATVLIGRDGTVIHFDLTRANLDKVIARAVGR